MPLPLRLFAALTCLLLASMSLRAQAPTPAAPVAPPDGRQRLALVVGTGKVGERVVLPSAGRDAPAVAAALAAGGYEVLLRENPSAGDLRAALQQFRSRLKPDALGLIYLTGPMAQVDGRNLLVPSDATLNDAADGPATAALLRVVGVPVQEAVGALAGDTEAPRVLVLDGAWRIAPLSRLTPPGLTRQRTPEGTMVLLGHLPAALQDPLPAEPVPPDAKDPKARAATRLAKAIADALTLSGVTVAEALRAVRLEVLDASGGRAQPVITGNLAQRLDFAQKPAVLAAAAPATPAASAAPVAVPGPSVASGAASSATPATQGPSAAPPPVGNAAAQAAAGSAGSPAGMASGGASAAASVAATVTGAVLPALPATVGAVAAAAPTAAAAAAAGASSSALAVAPGGSVPAAAGAGAGAPTAAEAASAPAAAASSPNPARLLDARTERAPGQGERPVYQTRSNSFGHAEGDVLSYERIDTRKDEVLASYVIAIDQIEGGGMLLANGGRWQLDPEGRPVSVKGEDGSETRFEPAEAWWWARPKTGESRPVQFSESYQRADGGKGRIAWRGQAQVGTARTLEVQAGEFEVLPIRITGQGTDSPDGKPARTLAFTRVVYFAPKLGVPVAIDIEDNDPAGRPLKRERLELTHAQQSRTLLN